MPTKLQSFKWSVSRGQLYDWDLLLNGDIWKLTVNEVKGTLRSFAKHVYTNAQRRDLKVRCVVKEGEYAVLQAYDPNTEPES